jgi:hypothetical protein
MSEYSMIGIDIRLYTDNMENDYIVYRQTIPVNVLQKINPKWLEQIIANINGLEIPHV